MTMDRCLYFAAVQSALADKCQSGNLVYHGHSGHLLLKGVPAVLKIRLIAPMAKRIQTVMERQDLAYEAARDYIHHIDRDRARWAKFVYRVDWEDPANYDLVINLADIDLGTACDMVSSVARRPAWVSTEPLKKKLNDFALACRVKLALVSSPESRAICFNVTADDGKVEILGEAPGSGSLVKRGGPGDEKLRAIAATVEGVREVRVSLHWFADNEA
jgi:hypothetical protein